MFLWSNPKLTHANWFCRLTVDGCDCSPNDGKLFAPLASPGHTYIYANLFMANGGNKSSSVWAGNKTASPAIRAAKVFEFKYI